MAGMTPYTPESWRKTNADRIRATTDEELAGWLEQFASCEICPAIRERCGYGNGCMKAWLDWLKQEVEEDEP